jgi:peptide/nickel transport system ATP-binding protein
MAEALLAFDNVDVTFPRRGPPVEALKGVSFEVRRGGSLGIIGDSGAGKSTICRVAEGLVRPSGGRVVIDGVEMNNASEREWQKARRNISLVFQDAQGSFNPMRPVVDSIGMPLMSYSDASKAELRRKVGEVMEQVGLSGTQMTRYPHEFSGGQVQRLAIARALVTRPRLVLFDEPVSALDVSIRAQILNLLTDLAKSLSLTYVVISSDPSVARHLSEDMIVLFAGKVIERAPTKQLFADPQHGYTLSLLSLRDPRLAARAELQGLEDAALADLGKSAPS